MSRFPQTLDAITAPWLTEVIAAFVPGARVRSVRAGSPLDGTNQNGRLEIDYEPGVLGPRTLIAKLPPRKARQRTLVERTGMGRREVDFYARFAEAVPLRVPRAYFAESDPETGDFLMLLEDVSVGDASLLDPSESVSASQAERVMEDLAAMHVASGRELTATASRPAGLLRMPDYGVGMLGHALTTRRSNLTPEFAALAELYIAETDAVHDAWEVGVPALVHGDAHLTNLFQEQGRVGFFDWGCMAWAPAMRDVSYFLCMSLSIDDRRARERSLLRAYVTARERLGDVAIDFDTAWTAHRIHAAYTVPAAAPTVIQPEGDGPLQRYARVFAARASAAIADLEAEAALRAAMTSTRA